MKREYDFKPWYGVVRFFAFNPLPGLMLHNGVLFGYDPESLVHWDDWSLGMDGVAE